MKRFKDSIFDNDYVCTLAISNHLRELVATEDKLAGKGTISALEIGEKYNNELMDLYLLLEEKFAIAPEYWKEIQEYRIEKFKKNIELDKTMTYKDK